MMLSVGKLQLDTLDPPTAEEKTNFLSFLYF